MGLFDQEDLPPAESDDKDRLFQTLRETSGSSRNYLKLLLIVALFVVAVGAVIYYLTLPGVGDEVRGPKPLEDRVRTHFLEKEKRDATDLTFFTCGDHYWVRVDVEPRPDIQANPVYRFSRYRAIAFPHEDGTWDITASPVTSPEMDVPCSK